MCCLSKAFWKGIVAFCLTFSLSVFVSSFFTLGQAHSSYCSSKNNLSLEIQTPENSAISETKNCVPVDGSLKYERLTTEEKPNLEAKKTEDKKKSLKAEKEKQNNPAQPKPQFYNPSKTDAEYKDLLHREKCFESDGRK
jgi:hypothetical protein